MGAYVCALIKQNMNVFWNLIFVLIRRQAPLILVSCLSIYVPNFLSDLSDYSDLSGFRIRLP